MRALELTKLGEYARQTKEMAEAVLADPPPGLDATIRALVESIGQLAGQTEERATNPVKIGVVGRFNAGKTLLLGGLVGFADGIPVKPIPTTGNITALHFTPTDDGEDIHSTRFQGFEVQFLDQESARACLGEMLTEAGRLAPQARLTTALVEALTAFDPNEKRTLTKLEGWCREAWAGSEDFAPMRMLLRELVWFVRAYLQCGEALCNPAQRYPISAEAAQDGLSLAIPDEVRSLRFDDLPRAPQPVTSAPDQAAVTPEFLRSVFPLIARLRVDVVVARGVWDLRSLRGANEFVLLDFPGLGAAFSGVRDRFLCRRELGEVQTVLLLLSSKEPGGGGWDDIYAPLAAKRADFSDCVLVGMSLFDCLKLTEPERKWLETSVGLSSQPAPAAGPSLAKPSAPSNGIDWGDDDDTPPVPSPPPAATSGEPLTEAKLLEGISTLKVAVSVAESMVPSKRRDRIVLLSPVLYLNKLADEDSRLTVATPAFLPELRREGESAAKAQALWQAVAKKLRANDPTAKKDGLTRWLEQFATDGGIGALRALLESHVNEHGLRQLVSDTEAKARTLKQALDRLNGLLPKPVGPTTKTTDPDRAQAIREAIRKLKDHYRTVANQVKQGLVLQIERDGVGVSVSQVIDEEVVAQIYAWPQWDHLLQSLRDGYIVEGYGGGVMDDSDDSASEDKIVWEEDDEEEGAPGDDFPTRSEDFFGVFERTLTHLQEFTRQQIEGGVDFWLRQIGEGVGPDRRELARALANPNIGAEIKRLKLENRFRSLLPIMKAAVEPPQLKKLIFKADDPTGVAANRQLDPARLFPQARPSGQHDPGRIYGWANKLLTHRNPDYRPNRNLAHQAQVIRLRDEFITIVCQEMTQIVSLALKKLNEKIGMVLADVGLKLARTENHDPLIDTLARGTATPVGPTSPATDSLVIIRQLASISWPLGL